LIVILLPVLLFGQIPSNPPAAATGQASNSQWFFRAPYAQPAVPADALELVTGSAESVQSVSQRASVVKMLNDAYAMSNGQAYPYDRRTSFVAFGSSSSDGSWQLEDSSPKAGLYRWTAQGPSYSVINLYKDQELYSNQAAGLMPMRLAQVRAAMFFMRPVAGPRATLRVAPGSLHGASLQCVLLTHNDVAKGVTGGRRWEEAEYCLDTKSGALITYSPAPGIYTQYDYSQAIHFHDRLIYNAFTISQAGRTIIEAKTISVEDPAKDLSSFEPTGLNELGVGSLLTAPWRYRSMVPVQNATPGTSDVVVVHGMQSAAGPMSETEVVASSSSAFHARALELASKIHGAATVEDGEPGATVQSHEVLLTIQFASLGGRPFPGER
jgi:hypothetical protein